MSLPPGLQAASHEPVPGGEPSPEIPLWVILAAVAVLLAGAVVAGLALVQDHDDKSSPSYPSAWDPRIAPYVKVVEKQRGLPFRHPVAVRFLPRAQFEKEITADKSHLGEEERTKIKQATGLMRALGLLTGDVDLFDAFNDAKGSGTLAYYSFDDERITIRGLKLTPSARATLVHELTHALQDQSFRIGDRMEKLRKESADGETTTEADVLQAIIEGDAERVANLYRESLGPKQRKAADAGRQRQAERARGELKHVPKVVLTMLSSPYTLGEALVQAAAADGGNHAVDALFLKAPTHDAALLDPFEVLAGDTGAADVDVPELKEGEKKFDAGEFGVLTWYFMLAERLPLRDALAAADGWGGDAYVAFERDGDSCARIAYSGDTPQDTTRMLHALRRWIAAAPGSPAAVSRRGDRVVFESCDPGTAADVGNNASIDALQLAATRTYVGVGILRSGAPTKLARCVAGRLAREFPVSQLVDPRFGAGGSARTRVQQIVADCR